MTKAEKRKLIQEELNAWRSLKLWEKSKDASPEDEQDYYRRLDVWCKVNHICLMFMSPDEISSIEDELAPDRHTWYTSFEEVHTYGT